MSTLKLSEQDLAKVLLPGARSYLDAKIREQIKVMAEDIVEQAARDLAKTLESVVQVWDRSYINGNVQVTLIVNDKQKTSP